MSPQQTAVYRARIRDRIAALRKNTNTNASSIKTRITNTVRRDSLGRQGESARQAHAASLGEYYDGSQKSENDLRDVGLVEDYWYGWDGDSGEQDWDVRSDSMESLRDGEGEEIVDGDEEGDEGREDWELDMNREDERCMEVDRSMSLESLIAEKRFLNGEVESEMYVAYHSLNSRAMRKMRLGEVERMYQSGGRYSMVGKKKRCEIQDVLQMYSENPNTARQEDEDDVVSNPYPEDNDLIPLTRQPDNRSPCPPTPHDPNKANPYSSADLSISSNPHPENAPTPLTQPPPPAQSPYSPHRAIAPSPVPSRFPIHPSDRAISPIAPFNTLRHVPFPVSAFSTRSHTLSTSDPRANAYNNVEDYASSHPYHVMDQQETQEYWHDLQNYNTESERHLRLEEAARSSRQHATSPPVQYRDDRVFGSAGEDYDGIVGDETEGKQRERVGAKKVNMVGRCFSTFACRTGAVSPEDAAVPVKNDADAGMVSIVPRKYAMAYLPRKMGRTQQKEEDGRLRERLLALQLSAPNEQRTRQIESTRKAIEDAQQAPRAKRRDESTRRGSKARVVNVESQTQGVVGPPVDFSKMIQRAPESIRTSSPLLQADAGPLGIREDVHHTPGKTHSSSSSSLSDRLRQTKLEDLPLHFEAAEEIRNLMLDLERDQNGPTTTTVQHRGRLPSNFDPNTPPARQASKLPGGFVRPGTSTTPPKPSTSRSPRETLERHFNTQRQANKQHALQVRAAKSHSSNFTLPPSFRAPEMHSSALSIPREPSPLVQMASAEDFWATKSGEEGAADGDDDDDDDEDDDFVTEQHVERQYAGTDEFPTRDSVVKEDGKGARERE